MTAHLLPTVVSVMAAFRGLPRPYKLRQDQQATNTTSARSADPGEPFGQKEVIRGRHLREVHLARDPAGGVGRRRAGLP